jgi:hypothetical protein
MSAENWRAPNDGHKGARNMWSGVGYNKVLKDFKTVVHLVGFIYWCNELVYITVM